MTYVYAMLLIGIPSHDRRLGKVLIDSILLQTLFVSKLNLEGNGLGAPFLPFHTYDSGSIYVKGPLDRRTS